MKEGRLARSSAYICLALCLFSITLPVSVFECSAQTGFATVAVSPPSITASVGQNFSVNVTVGNVSDPYGVYGWEFTLNWTESLLDSVDIIEGPFLKSGGATFFTYNNSTAGHMIVDCTLEGEVPGVNGTGTLATLTFHVNAAGQSPLDLYNATLVDGATNPTDIPCEVVGGYGYFALSAVAEVLPSKTVVGRGYSMNVTVTATDPSNYTETFNVTVYANTTSIGSQSVTLSSGNSTNLIFTWNTTSFVYSKYAISAYATPVPGESTGGNVTVTIPGDLNGDFNVGLPDLTILALAYGTRLGDARWNANADIDGNGAVDLVDLTILAYYYGQHYP